MNSVDKVRLPARAPFVFALMAATCFILAVIVSPERLLSMGVMEVALTSEMERVRALALLEIRIGKIALAIAGALLLAFVLLWKKFCKLPVIVRICNHRDLVHDSQQDNKILNSSLAVIIMGMLLACIHIAFGKTHWHPRLFELLNTEDGIVENISALLFLACSITSLATIAMTRPNVRRQTVMILFAIGFFLCFGEEISWGQRIFGFGTPESMQAVNVQNEVNIHNMFGLLSDHIFLLAMLTYGVLLPALQRIHPFWRSLFSLWGLPIASPGLALGFFIVALLQTNVIWRCYPPAEGIWIKEIRELLMALGLLRLLFEYRRTLSSVSGA